MSHPYSDDRIASDSHNPSTPNLHEVLQEYEPSNPAVDVGCIESPVRVQQLPSRMAISRSYTAGTGTAVPLLNADERRRRAVIIGMLTTSADSTTSLGFYVGAEEDVKSGNAAIWPYNVPLTIEHAQKVYVRATGTVTTPVNVSLISENWAD
jgi:hypothetical protein